MRRRVAPRVPNSPREHRRTVRMTASAALLMPLLAGPAACTGGTAADRQLQNVFTDAADEYHVPRSVLLGVSYLQSRWDARPGTPSVLGGYGPMHLVDTRQAKAKDKSQTPAPSDAHRGGTQPPAAAAGPSASPGASSSVGRSAQPADLRRAAGLIGAPVARLRTDAKANVRGGAALLAETQRQLGKPLSTNPADWWEAVARFPGTGDTASAAEYANNVFALIRKGAQRTTDSGQQVTLAASPGVHPRTPTPRPHGGPRRSSAPRS